ncbi:DUF4855 domain-containing protein [Chitinophaga qingshengii]|uniref:DUF4855 domain-containing protein n=1 Tax=Chitinophaga qingshengii TaxID=1569794 RepID=A0ABR7TNU2_9BACT|nr:DUF4855 domain-containing protein [Chitinophaga qingshengii]MBC9932149.1 DUF4855 domain-containing protein [Chitinophaga qingshengii]
MLKLSFLLTSLAFMVSTASVTTSCQKAMLTGTPEEEKNATTLNSPTAVKPLPSWYISDLALIYQGGVHRLPWTKDQLKPYIYRTTSTGIDWLFDGFLFIEFTDGQGHEYAEGYDPLPAGKAEWQWLLDRNFESGKALHALDDVLDSLAQLNIKPVRKRKVVLTLPEPIQKLSNWGELNGKILNFADSADRVAACKWYVDTALAMWQAANFKHIELQGFYWVAEQNTGAAQILPVIANNLHAKQQRFYWIPYYGAAGAGNWKAMGFDIAYQQPNYFFDLASPYSILTGAINFAKSNKMALEMEFDGRLLTEAGYRQKYTDYINEFDKSGAWKNLPVAYYEGGGGWLQMSQSTDTTIVSLVKRLSDIIVTRQKAADTH